MTAGRAPDHVTRCTLALVLVLSLAGAALAGAGEIVSPEAGSILRPGTTVEVTWTGIPAEVDELEILLALDDDSGYTVRLTSQLEPALGHYSVVVPHLPSRSAHLRLRMGLHGSEVDGPRSARLTIAPEPAAPLATVRPHEGELWTGREVEVESRPVAHEPALRGERDDQQRKLPATTCSTQSLDLAPATPATARLDEHRPSRSPSADADHGHAPLSIPLRP